MGWTGAFLRLEIRGSQPGSGDLSGEELEAPGETALALTSGLGATRGSQPPREASLPLGLCLPSPPSLISMTFAPCKMFTQEGLKNGCEKCMH